MGGVGTDYQVNLTNGKLILPTLQEANFTNADGRDFLGWSTTPNGRDNIQKPGSEYTGYNATTFYAVWSYQVTFDANEAYGGSGESFKVNVPQEKRITAPQKPAGFTNDNDWMFIGWHGMPSGHHKGTGLLEQTYVPNVEYPGEKTGQVIDRDITLYAVWLDTEAKGGQPVEFYIRLDNQIPFEPKGHGASDYTARNTYSMVGTIRQQREVNNNPAWVKANILTEPSVAAIKSSNEGTWRI